VYCDLPFFFVGLWGFVRSPSRGHRHGKQARTTALLAFRPCFLSHDVHALHNPMIASLSNSLASFVVQRPALLFESCPAHLIPYPPLAHTAKQELACPGPHAQRKTLLG
jgi:hypothetical protein